MENTRTPQAAYPRLDERQWAAAAHLSALLLALLTSWLVGVAGVVAAGVVYLLKRDDSAFVAAHAAEAINFNLSMLVYAAVALAIGIGLFGFTVLTLGLGAIVAVPAALLLLLVLGAIALLWLVCGIVATVKAWNGEQFRYPLSIRLV